MMTRRDLPESVRQAARDNAQRAYDNGHRWSPAQLNLLARTVGARLAAREEAA